ncbi:dihydrolipoyl dehydrogenase [Celerinatantimonas sp. MCCC 1A17872]|uniref:dihydrolipoyl dehydrogenase n=1 Tax=Celerinatantimonas sp. MCCC 1A17872 TaxID=3177514 RepID=UPI0038C2A1E9
MKTNVLVIGGGPGGHVAAIKLAELGKKVTVVEKYKLGGTCLHQGCIPTKTMLYTSELLAECSHAETIGLNVEHISVDMHKLQARKNQIINNITTNLDQLIPAKGVELIRANASLINEKEALLLYPDGTEQHIEFEQLILATGSEPAIVNIPGAHLKGVITSDEALCLESVPKEMVIIGGGVIGIEFAQMLNRFGAKVTIIEAAPKILPHMDQQLTQELATLLEREGISIYTNAKVQEIQALDDGKLTVSVDNQGQPLHLEATQVLMAVGRKPLTHGFGLENTQVAISRGAIDVNEQMQTNIEHIYAIGDCTGGYMLAHVASAQGIVAAENIAGQQSDYSSKTVPACVYTQPEFASVGLTEEAAKKQYKTIKVGLSSLGDNAKTVIHNQTGLVKWIVDAQTARIVGLHILGPRASDMIHEGALSLTLNATYDDILGTIHAHPTISEGIHEAAEDLNQNAIYKLYQ